jgi:RNA polymerase sigma factor (sigma-70 family)
MRPPRPANPAVAMPEITGRTTRKNLHQVASIDLNAGAVTLNGVDEAEFTKFVRAEFPKLVLFVEILGANFHTAEDIAQMSFVKAWEWWCKIEYQPAWIRCVAHHLYLNHVTRTRERPWGLELPDRPWGERLERPGVKQQPWEQRRRRGGGYSYSPEDYAMAIDLNRRMPAALNALSPTQRAVLAWTMDGRFGPEEIAEAMEISVKAVSVHRAQGRKRLKEILRLDEQESA